MTHVIVWEFYVRAGFEREFEDVYGSSGDWARLFARSADFQGTELVRDASTAGRYLTVDRWESAEAFEEFRKTYAAEYEALDARCEAWTETEVKIGTWVTA